MPPINPAQNPNATPNTPGYEAGTANPVPLSAPPQPGGGTGKGAATTTLVNAQNAYNQNPLVIALQGLLGDLTTGNNWQTYKPEDIARQKAQAASTAHQGADAFLGQRMSRLTAMGSGARSGAANRLLGQTATRLGSELSAGDRAVEQQAMLQRNQDLQNLFGLVQGQLGQQFQFPRDIANAQLGIANLQTQQNIANQSNAASGFAGAGAAAASIAGALIGK